MKVYFSYDVNTFATNSVYIYIRTNKKNECNITICIVYRTVAFFTQRKTKRNICKKEIYKYFESPRKDFRLK